MGCYINPEPPQTKEKWIGQHGITLPKIMGWEHAQYQLAEDEVLCVWADNGPFTIIAVLYDKEEFERFHSGFSSGKDPRPHVWLKAKENEIRQVAPLDTYR